jgi:hypothetical protein
MDEEAGSPTLLEQAGLTDARDCRRRLGVGLDLTAGDRLGPL